MAEKRRKLANDATWRENIKTAHILEKLSNHVFGMVTMEMSQIKSAEILLKKTIPDVMQIQVDVSGGLTVEVLQVASHKVDKRTVRKIRPAPVRPKNASSKTASE